jgi:hypothetical protein
MSTLYNGQPVEGGTYPAIIWHNFMVQALQILASESPQPQDQSTTTTTSTSPATTGSGSTSSGSSSGASTTSTPQTTSSSGTAGATSGGGGGGTGGGGGGTGGSGGTGGGTSDPAAASFTFTRATAGRGGRIALALRFPARGTVKVVATAKVKGRRIVWAATKRAVAVKAGRRTLTLVPSRAAKTTLKTAGKVKVTVRVTFARSGAAASARSRTVTARR